MSREDRRRWGDTMAIDVSNVHTAHDAARELCDAIRLLAECRHHPAWLPDATRRIQRRWIRLQEVMAGMLAELPGVPGEANEPQG